MLSFWLAGCREDVCGLPPSTSLSFKMTVIQKIPNIFELLVLCTYFFFFLTQTTPGAVAGVACAIREGNELYRLAGLGIFQLWGLVQSCCSSEGCLCLTLSRVEVTWKITVYIAFTLWTIHNASKSYPLTLKRHAQATFIKVVLLYTTPFSTWYLVLGSCFVQPGFCLLLVTQHTWKMWDFFFLSPTLSLPKQRPSKKTHSSLTWKTANGLWWLSTAVFVCVCTCVSRACACERACAVRAPSPVSQDALPP